MMILREYDGDGVHVIIFRIHDGMLA
jgi:hypothetical protein